MAICNNLLATEERGRGREARVAKCNNPLPTEGKGWPYVMTKLPGAGGHEAAKKGSLQLFVDWCNKRGI